MLEKVRCVVLRTYAVIVRRRYSTEPTLHLASHCAAQRGSISLQEVKLNSMVTSRGVGRTCPSVLKLSCLAWWWSFNSVGLTRSQNCHTRSITRPRYYQMTSAIMTAPSIPYSEWLSWETSAIFCPLACQMCLASVDRVTCITFLSESPSGLKRLGPKLSALDQI